MFLPLQGALPVNRQSPMALPWAECKLGLQPALFMKVVSFTGYQ